MRNSLINWILAMLIIVFLAGCAGTSKPTRFYRLDEGAPSADQIDLKPQPGVPLLGVANVTLARYLDQPQIVERRSQHQVELHEFDQWAGSLQENLQLLICDSLQHQLQKVQVIAYPWQSSVKPDFELYLHINRFDLEEQQISLQVRWSLIELRSNRLVEMQQITLYEAISGSGIEAGVSAANRAVSKLAERIAKQIRGGAFN
jgi:uncharacterized protein